MKVLYIVAAGVCVIVAFLLLGSMQNEVGATTGKLWRTSDLKASFVELYSQPLTKRNWDNVENVPVVGADLPINATDSGKIYKLGDIEWFQSSGAQRNYIKRQGDTAFRQVTGDPWNGGYPDFYVDSDAVMFMIELEPHKMFGETYWRVYPSIADALKVGSINSDGIVTSLYIDESYHRVLLSRGDGTGKRITDRVRSNDGRYMLAQVEYKTLVKINLMTQEATVIDAKRPEDMNAPHPGAITDDGTIAINGKNTTVYRITNCGDDFNGALIGGIQGSIQNPCSSYSMGNMISGETAGDSSGDSFRFIENDSRLLSTHLLYPDATSIVVSTSGVDSFKRPHLKYLALGDSYSSGEGDMDQRANGASYYINDTGGTEGCHLSSRSYPYLLRDKWQIVSSEMRSVACSGARVNPDYHGSNSYYGQSGQLLDYASSTQNRMKSNALDTFTPGILRQIDYVKEYQPSIVTVTGGGNDVGFADIISYCASSYRLFNLIPINETCSFVYNKQQRANLNRTIDNQYILNKRFIEKIREVSPMTKIYLVGYPQFVKADSHACLRNSVMLNNQEIIFIRESVVRMNNTLKRVVQDAGIHYVDIEDSLEGGQICQGSKYMTGPLGAIIKNGQIRKDDNMYHPNAAGHKKIAETIAAKVNTNLDYEIIDIPLETNGYRVVKQAVLPDYVGVGSTHMVTMGPGIIGPDGVVAMEMFSKTVKLGVAQAGGDGSLQAKITIPDTVPAGVHLLAITGKDSDGEMVQVQQFVTIVRDVPMTNDKSEAGVKVNHTTPLLATEKQPYPAEATKERSTLLSKPAMSMNQMAVTTKASGDNNLSLWWIVAITGILLLGLTTYAKRSNKAKKH